MELKNKKTECVNENEDKENKNVEEFHEFILQQKLANTKVKTQSDMKSWKQFYLKGNKNRELCDIHEEELNLLLCKFFKCEEIRRHRVQACQFDVLSIRLERKRLKCKYY